MDTYEKWHVQEHVVCGAIGRKVRHQSTYWVGEWKDRSSLREGNGGSLAGNPLFHPNMIHWQLKS